MPLIPGEVRIYVCGVTPYDVTHLGHAFSYVQFDTLRCYLEWTGHRVRYGSETPPVKSWEFVPFRVSIHDWWNVVPVQIPPV